MPATTNQAPVKPHCDAQRPYGYSFEAIDLYKFTDFREAFQLLCELGEDHEQYDICLGEGCPGPLVERVAFEVASHIEGNFGPPYNAILVYSEAHNGRLFIFAPKGSRWWNGKIGQCLSNYLMGLRSLLDLLA